MNNKCVTQNVSRILFALVTSGVKLSRKLKANMKVKIFVAVMKDKLQPKFYKVWQTDRPTASVLQITKAIERFCWRELSKLHFRVRIRTNIIQ